MKDQITTVIINYWYLHYIYVRSAWHRDCDCKYFLHCF